MFCIISLIIMYQNGSDHYCVYVTVAATETFVSRNVLCVCVCHHSSKGTQVCERSHKELINNDAPVCPCIDASAFIFQFAHKLEKKQEESSSLFEAVLQ